MPRGVYKRKPQTAEHIRHKVEARVGYRHSQETIEKMRKSNLGKKRSEQSKKKMSLSHVGKKHSEEWKRNISIGLKGIKKPPRTEEHKRRLSEAKKKEYQNGKISPLKKMWQENPDFLRGENNPCWIKDRTKIKIGDRQFNDPLQKQWSMGVKKRDRWKCIINNKDCKGKVVAHHILSWKDYPELRYNLNNGITLCLAHHPRKRAEEKRLIPFFQGLVPVSNELTSLHSQK